MAPREERLRFWQSRRRLNFRHAGRLEQTKWITQYPSRRLSGVVSYAILSASNGTRCRRRDTICAEEKRIATAIPGEFARLRT
jgi:hypothetical protein